MQEGDTTKVSTASALDFGAGFDVSESPTGEANIALDLTEYGTGTPDSTTFLRGDGAWASPGGGVSSVNGETGTVSLSASDVGADPSGTATSAISAHEAASDPHPGYLTTAEGAAAFDAIGAAASAAASAVSAHQSDTTSVHGISDTSALVLTDDSRLSNARTPSAHATSHQDGGSDELALDASQVTTGVFAGARLPSSLTALRFANAGWYGHSLTQLGDGSAAGDSASVFQNYLRKLIAVMNVTEVRPGGLSGAQLCSPADGSGTDAAGIGAILKAHYPNAWYQPRSGSQAFPTRPVGRAMGGLWVLHYGINEVLRNASGTSTLAANTYANHLRVALARIRAAMVYDSRAASVAYSGFGTTVTSGDSGHGYAVCTGPSWRKSTTNGNTVTITLPTDFRGGTVTVVLVAPTNTKCYLNGAHNNSTTTISLKGSILSDAGYKALTAGDQILVDSERITLGSTADGGVTWTGCTRAAGGTTAASHSDGAVVTLPTTTGNVAWSGTATGATGTTYVAGQGYACDGVYSGGGTAFKTPGFVQKRFVLTAADAGKTIIATVAGLVGNEFVGFDHWSIEDADPPQILVVNHADMGGTIAAGGSLFTGANATAINDAATTVQAEFDANVAVVDVASDMRNRFYATVQTQISSGATTTLHVTPLSASLNEIGVGSQLRVLGAAGIEKMLVTAITKTSDTDWSLTVTRNADGAGAQTTIAVGKPVMDSVWLAPDWIHLSDHGSNLYAKACLEVLVGLTRTYAQAVNTGSLLVRHPRMRNRADRIITPAATRTTLALTLNQMLWVRHEIPEHYNLEKIFVQVTTGGSAGSIIRAAVAADGKGAPGSLIAEMTQVATTATGRKECTEPSSGAVPLVPGFYWFGIVAQVAAPTVRAVTHANALWAALNYDWDAYVDGTGVLALAHIAETTVSGAVPSARGTLAWNGPASTPIIGLVGSVQVRD